ncbi:MAG: DUF3352 domain-containing protein [Thermoleophilaceae bacterium]
MRRLAALLAVAALCVLGAAGCGGHDSKPNTALDDALGYFAKDAPFVAAVETDPDGAQIKQVRSLAGRLPIGGSLIDRVLGPARLESIQFDRDIRPQLGAPLVVGLARPAAGRGLSTPLVLAMRVKNPSKVKQLLLRQPAFLGRGKSSGARIYENRPQSRYAALDGDVLVAATNRDFLEQALAMHRSDNRMRESGFDRDLAGLPAGALARVSADPRALIGADARLRPALGVKWLASLRRLGATVKALGDGVAFDLRVAADAGSIGDADLPLAPKPGPLPLVGGERDLQIGVRQPGRLARFARAVLRAVAPRRAARVDSLEPPGVDLARQLPRHLGDVGVLALDPLKRAFGARVALRDAADVQSGLAQLAPALPDMAAALGIQGLGVATPEAGESFYALAKPKGGTVVFGVVGSSLVAADQARRAADLASEPTHTVPGPARAAVFTIDARVLAGRLIAERLNGPAALAAPFVVAALRDLSGWLAINRSGMHGHAKLTIVK